MTTELQCLKSLGVLIRYLRLFLLHRCGYLICGLTSTTRSQNGNGVGRTCWRRPTALEKVAGGPLMAEVDLGPGVALRGATDTDNGLLCW